MTQAKHETKEIWTTGRRECHTCITAIVYSHIIVAAADMEEITECQMEKALNREFPQHNFVFNGYGGKYCIRADAARWPGDGV